MASSTTNIANLQQSFMNNITQVSSQSCLANSTGTTNNNVIIVTGSKIDGNFTGVTNTVTTDATCMITSTMEDSVSDILSATVQQVNTSETDLFGDFSFTSDVNKFNLAQTVVNNISQINEITCSSNTTTSQSNNYVYLSNVEVKGNFVGTSGSGTATANCSMNNTMKNTTYNQAQGDSSQENTIKGMFVAIAATFASIIGLVVIGVIILFAVGAVGYVGYESTSKYKSSKGGSSYRNLALAEANSLGLTSEELSLLSF